MLSIGKFIEYVFNKKKGKSSNNLPKECKRRLLATYAKKEKFFSFSFFFFFFFCAFANLSKGLVRLSYFFPFLFQILFSLIFVFASWLFGRHKDRQRMEKGRPICSLTQLLPELEVVII